MTSISVPDEQAEKSIIRGDKIFLPSFLIKKGLAESHGPHYPLPDVEKAPEEASSVVWALAPWVGVQFSLWVFRSLFEGCQCVLNSRHGDLKSTLAIAAAAGSSPASELKYSLMKIPPSIYWFTELFIILPSSLPAQVKRHYPTSPNMFDNYLYSNLILFNVLKACGGDYTEIRLCLDTII